jgi:DNA-binding transcriptional MocR family regulator
VEIVGTTASEIFESIRSLVQRGHVEPGSTLPPLRELAERLGVNRNTVASAYRRLAQAGIAVTQGRLGTTICATPYAGEQEGANVGTALIDLASGNPNPAWLPPLDSVLPGCQFEPRLYGEPTINPALESIGRKWLSPDCPANSVITLTNGAVDAIERLAAAHLVPGDRVIVEDPCFLGTINALRLAGMQTVGVEVDGSGMLPDALADALDKGAQAVLITPRAHNPTGCSFTKRRAEALRRVLENYPDVLIIADDHFALLAETPYYSIIPTSTSRWALIRSVSKGLGPDLRLALVACDRRTGARLQARLSSGTTWVSHILQGIVAAMLTSPDSMKMLSDAKARYIHQRAELCRALISVGLSAAPGAGGFNIWIPLETDAKTVAFALASKGWLVRVGDAFDVEGESQAIRVTVSQMRDGQAQQFAAALRTCLA